jgi:hypothetical protein
MNPIYAGDTKNVLQRIYSHCSGNVEGSSLRETLASDVFQFQITKVKRPSGSIKKRIAQPWSIIGEQTVSQKIKKGYWQFLDCVTKQEAHDFQFYVIEQLSPFLNKQKASWNIQNEQRYKTLLNQLLNSSLLSYDQIKTVSSGPGVYLHLND